VIVAITAEIDRGKLESLSKAVKNAGKNMPKELAAAINQVSKKTRLDMGREVRKVIAVKKEASERHIKVLSRASPESLEAMVTVQKGNKPRRPGLQHFGARQNGTGVSYKISKTGGRKTIKGAFMGPKPGQLAPGLYGGVYKRSGGPKTKVKKQGSRYIGKMREPIIKLNGVSVWAAYTKNNLTGPQMKAIAAELTKQIDRRIRLNILRASGLVKT
jgi:hypothetical protein